MAKKKQAPVEEESSGEITITRSFARKLNMAAHGGKQYETADIFCTVTKLIAEEDIAVVAGGGSRAERAALGAGIKRL